MVRRIPIIYSGSVGAAGTLTRYRQIKYEAQIQDIIAKFALNQQRQLRVYILVGGTHTLAGDDNVLKTSDTNATPYLVGDDSKSEFHALNYEIKRNEYLTVYADNQDPANALTLDVEIVIRKHPRGRGP